MKVLWLTHVMPNAVLQHLGLRNGGTGFWVSALLEEIKHEKSVSVTIGYESSQRVAPLEVEGVRYVSLPRVGLLHTLYAFNYERAARKTITAARTLIESVEPDLVHIHGLEPSLALLTTDRGDRPPVCLSLQGLMGPCAEVSWGDQSFLKILSVQRWGDLRRGFYSLGARRRFRNGALRERRILHSLQAVMGRTAFDREYTRSVAPELSYFNVGELMRNEFYSVEWSKTQNTPFTIFSSGRLTFQKGFHVLIDAIAILRRVMPCIQVVIAGNTAPTGEFAYFRRKIHQYGLDKIFRFPGALNASEVAGLLSGANVYVNCSFIENSSNAIAEAMLIGTPVVASYVGGTPTMLDNGRLGQLYPVSRPEMLAACIRRACNADPEVLRMAAEARLVAQRRHSSAVVKSQLLDCYRSLVGRA